MIRFDEQIKRMWQQHASETNQVVASLADCINLVESTQHIQKINQFIVHLFTDHILNNSEALKWLNKVENSTFNNPETLEKLNSSKDIFNISDNPNLNISAYPIPSQIKILTGAASLFVFSKKNNQAIDFLNRAVLLSDSLVTSDDSYRILAVTGNNIACVIEEAVERNSVDSELMILAAKTGRKFWEKAGTWLEVERAEYRLAKSYLKNKDFINSIKHANLCLTICEQNSAPALELFFAFEAIAQVEKSIGQPLRSLEKMKHYFNLLSEADKQWCGSTLDIFMK